MRYQAATGNPISGNIDHDGELTKRTIPRQPTAKTGYPARLICVWQNKGALPPLPHSPVAKYPAGERGWFFEPASPGVQNPRLAASVAGQIGPQTGHQGFKDRE